ncbi:MAG: hypothetical protein ACPGEG_02395 [Salibacteraceae bacterium]
MNRILSIVAISLMSIGLFAQAPNQFSYQAVLRDAQQNIIVNNTVGIQISILQGSISGIAVYEETHTPSTNINGLISLEIGSGTVVSGSISTIDWSQGPYFIKTETDPNGGTNYTISGTSQMLSVPYSLHAQTATIADSSINNPNEQDPIFTSSVAYALSSTDTTKWNQKLSSEVDGSVTNEIQALSISNDTVFLSNGGSVILPSAPINNDNDSTNEIQQLTASNDTLYLNNGGGYVTFTNLITWLKNSNDLYFETGNVAIGHESPDQPLHIYDSITHGNSSNYENGLLVESRITNSNANSNYAGIFSEVKGTDAYNTAVDGTSDGTSAGTNYGLGGYAKNAATNVGVEAFASGTNQKNYGLDGFAWNGSENYGVKGFAKANSEDNSKHVGVFASVEANNGLGTALYAKSTGTRAGTSIYAESVNDSSNTGIISYAKSSSTNNQDQYGIQGHAIGSSGSGTGVHRGVYGLANGSGTLSRGVEGRATSTSSQYNQGVFGYAIGAGTNSNGYNAGILGEAANHSILNYGVLSLNGATGNNNYGAANFVYGSVSGTKKNIGTYGYAWGADTNIALRGYAADDFSAVNYGIYSEVNSSTGSLAGRFLGGVRVEGNLVVTGSISKGSGTFKIDHPLDPENKFLVHSFVESPDMMNVYNGNAVTDASGFVTVQLPDYVERSNKDFRYQLTPMGQLAICVIKEKVNGNQFVIQTDKPNVEVSWQVTGIRNDPYANQNRIQPEVDKNELEKGKYLHPSAYNKDDSFNMYRSLDLGDTQKEVETLKKSSAIKKQ